MHVTAEGTNMKLATNAKLLFLLLFVMISFYILSIKTEKFQSSSTVIIKDLSQQQTASMLGSMLLGQSSSTMRDSKLLEVYIQSMEMFLALDKEHNLSNYYNSQKIDFIQRLNKDALFSFNASNNENMLNAYTKDVSLLYDEASSTLNIAFLHADPLVAQEIVQNILTISSRTLNRFERENASVALNALLSQEKENKTLFIDSIKQLILYQNKHHTIDPNADVQSKSAILATLEGELVQKEVAYKSKLSYLNKNTAEMKLLLGTLKHIKKSILTLKSQIAGGGKHELNKNVSDYELLKSEVDFNKERYKQTLIKLEETKVSVKQNAKNLIVVTKPTLASTYLEPQKFKDLLTLFIILSFLYGITTLILSILKDHKD
jgi:capsular polysaccharide transport system permease protein